MTINTHTFCGVVVSRANRRPPSQQSRVKRRSWMWYDNTLDWLEMFSTLMKKYFIGQQSSDCPFEVVLSPYEGLFSFKNSKESLRGNDIFLRENVLFLRQNEIITKKLLSSLEKEFSLYKSKDCPCDWFLFPYERMLSPYQEMIPPYERVAPYYKSRGCPYEESSWVRYIICSLMYRRYRKLRILH